MKAKEINQSLFTDTEGIVTQQDIENFDKIDKLTLNEFVDGEQVLDDSDIYNDGVELSIQGSDIEEEFPDPQTSGGVDENNTVSESDENKLEEDGEIMSSDDEVEISRGRIASKVVKVNRKNEVESNGTQKFDYLRNDPSFREFLKEVIGESKGDGRTDSNKSRHLHDSPDQHEKIDHVHARNTVRSSKHPNHTPEKTGKGIELSPAHLKLPLLAKSPSDTTIYTPGLRKASIEDVSLIEKISNFVESIRIDERRNAHRHKNWDGGLKGGQQDVRVVEQKQQHGNDRQYSSTGTTAASTSHDSDDEEPEKPSEIANQLLVQAEKFKARIEAPKGNEIGGMIMPYDKLRSKFVKPEGLAPIDSKILFLHNFDQDDEFFHVTSQIDPSLRVKIERGEFIDLERLLPKDGSRPGDDLNRQLYQLITQGTISWKLLRYPNLGKLIAFENGTKHSECMLLSIPMLIRNGHLKYGSTYMYFILLQPTLGTMFIFMISISES